MPKYATNRDARLRSIQATLAKGPIPILRAVETIRATKSGTSLDRKELDSLSQICMDSVSFFAHANEQINDFRREILKPTLKYKYQPLCKLPKDVDTSRLLLGENIGDRIKQINQAETLSGRRQSKIGRSKRRHNPYYPNYQNYQMQMGPHFGYPNQFPQYGGYQGFGQQQQPNQHKGQKQNFLGESALHIPCGSLSTHSELNFGSDYRPPTRSSDKSEMVYQSPDDSLSLSRQGQGPRKTQFPEVEDLNDGADDHTPDMVGELSIAQLWPKFKAGRVNTCFETWEKLTSDRTILSNIKHGYVIEFDDTPSQHKPAHEIKLKQDEYNFLKQELSDMLDKGIITKSQHEDNEYISNIFLRPKKTESKFRLILNLKKLNLFVDKQHFKMDTLTQTLSLITKNAWMVSLDFEDAYYSLAIHRNSRKFLKFMFDGVLYEFTCLPNGLTSAPRYFTKVLKVMLAYMREQMGITITGYLDDQFIIDDTYERVVEAGNYAAELFQRGGFKINLKKSVTTPTQCIDHLGFRIDSRNMLVHLTPEKREKLKKLLLDCVDDRHMSIRQVATLVGKCLATKPANPWALLYTKQLEIDKITALNVHAYNFDAKMKLSKEARQDLNWWLQNVDTLSSPIHSSSPDIVLKTDASLEGWGCFLDNENTSTGGRWSVEEQQFHINYLELKAILLSLKSVGRNWSDCHVRIRSDNTTAVSSINRQGSTHSLLCNEITKQIWEFAFVRKIWISAVHLPGTENVEADTASRKFQDETEWTLREDVFETLCKIFGQPDIDLFASRLNYRIKPFAAWKPDPEADMINSLMHDWGEFERVYAFPPFAIIHLVLQKFIEDRAEGILVVPYWKTKPWFTMFANLIVSEPLLIHVIDDVLFLPFDRGTEYQRSVRRTHPMAGKLRLVAALCTNNIGKLEAFRMRLLKRSRKDAGIPPEDCIKPTSIDGRYIVSRGVLIPFTRRW